MGKKIRVTPEELEKASKRMTELSETYTKISSQLLMEARTMGEAWQGEDNLAFVAQIGEFCDELRMMAEKFQTAGNTLMQQKTNYSSRVEQNIAGTKKL